SSTVAIMLFAVSGFVTVRFGSFLTLMCQRNSAMQILCSQQWRLLGFLPEGDGLFIRFQYVHRVCYRGGCNYFINTSPTTSVLANSSSHIDDFVNNRLSTSVTEQFIEDWLTPIAGIACM